MKEKMNLYDVYRPQDGPIEISVGERDEYGFRQVTVYENDEPYCYMALGVILVNDASEVVSVGLENMSLLTPANKPLMLRLCDMIGGVVDLTKYDQSHIK